MPWYQPTRKTSILKLAAVVVTKKSIESPWLTLVFDAQPEMASCAPTELKASHPGVPGRLFSCWIGFSVAAPAGLEAANEVPAASAAATRTNRPTDHAVFLRLRATSITSDAFDPACGPRSAVACL